MGIWAITDAETREESIRGPISPFWNQGCGPVPCAVFASLRAIHLLLSLKMPCDNTLTALEAMLEV